MHGMRIWPQIIVEMFWKFSMKAITERLNILHIYQKGITTESFLHRFKVEDIPVKSFNKLFISIYVLYARFQKSGGAGPLKWEPRSHIVVYLGNLNFHAGSVELVRNPTTGLVNL